MSDLRALYQEVILDHSKNPRNYGDLPEATCSANGHNPLCGDRITVSLQVKDGRIDGLKFEGNGCAISTASASMLTQALKGKTVAEAQELFESFHEMVTRAPDEMDRALEDEKLGKLIVFAGVSEFPVRVKCATLCWHTLIAALKGDSAGQVTTE